MVQNKINNKNKLFSNTHRLQDIYNKTIVIFEFFEPIFIKFGKYARVKKTSIKK